MNKKLMVVPLFVIIFEIFILVAMAILVTNVGDLSKFEIWFFQVVILFIMGYRIVTTEFWSETNANRQRRK